MKVVLVAFLLGLAAALPHQPKAPVCGYDSCPKPVANKLNVHMVPHTHDDVGWLKTVDQYYYGSRSNIQAAGVQYILDSVIDQLLKDPAKKFIYVETAFFWKWWVEQTPELQEQVKGLVNNGQLEFIGGAWSMNDEATTHYHTTIDQFTWGLRRLNDTFGSCGVPRVGWQIDPFGHSREQASLMAQYYFDGLFYARQDYQDRDNRLKNKAQEVIWETDDSLGDQTDLLTGALYAFYGAPGGFCFDVYCGDEPIIDNPDIPDYNVPRRVEEFVTFLNEQKQFYRTNNIMLSMGGDFQYMDASINFKNMDKLIKATNELHPEMNVFYSTPSCYVKSLNEANITWPTKQDDFFPYGSGPHTYWTGYFTSRPSLKRFERLAHNVLQVGKQLAAVVDIDDNIAEQLTVHKEAQGILQHHDAVAGTEKQHVAEDYARLLQIGVEATENVIAASLNTLLLQDQSATPLSFSSCPLRNISECAVTENSESFLVTVYNPLSRSVNSFVRFPVTDSTYSIIAPNGDEIDHQILQIPDHLARIPGRESKTTHDALFEAKNIPPFGYKTFYVTKVNDKKSTKSASRVWVPTGNQDVVVGDEDFSLTFDGKSKLLKSIGTNREIYDTVQSLEYYIGVIGDNGAEERRSSGAYCFRPTTNDSFAMSDGSNITIVDGPLVSEVHQIFSDWASQVIRHYYGHDVVEFEWLVGPIPIEDGDGKEVVMKWRTNLETDGVLVTDTSGRNDLTRKRDFRPTWDLEVHEPVAGNYYPIVLDAWIDNGTDRLALVTDRAQGAASIKDGELEVMVHRRLLHDDAFGAGEALNEEAYGQGMVARGTHWVLVGPTDGVASTQNIRLMEQQKATDSLAFFSDVSGKSYDDIKNSINLAFAGLTVSLPDEVQLLTLEPWKDNTLLLRLENIFTTEQQDASSVTVDLSNLFTTFTITSARETTLEMVMDQNPVMETLPAPDIVGREFVRQYYTLLNEAPEHAHRFYNSNSYFVHGPMSKPAIGQLEIHQKIQQLNFRDCHAKISQVDSQVTLGNGVVVQVSGELSNDGCPMRRFSQTFVLGTQSPKKYYVHNDIFRYQDTLHSDEEGDASVEKDDQQNQQQEQRDFYETVAPEENVTVLQPPQQAHQLPAAPVMPPHNHSVNGGIHHDEPVPVAVQVPIPVRVPEPVSVAEPHPPAPIANGGISMMTNEDLARNLPPNNATEAVSISRTAPAHITADDSSPPSNSDSVPIKDSYDQDSYQGQNNDSADTKPTFANLVRGNRNSRGPPPSRGIRSVAPPVSAPHPHSHSHHADLPPAASDAAPLAPPARSNYPDNQQVFMGNIPPEVTDIELREVFEVYGKVLEIKLFHNKKDGGCKSYGFVTFSESSEVSKVLKEKQIMLNKHPINVEEKKRQNKPQGGGGGHESGWSSGRGQSGRGRTPRGGGASRGTPFTRGSAPPPSRPPYNAKR